MAGVSSLLKSAQATQKKIRSQEDAEVAYEWSLSAKTYDQYLQYKQYLDDRASKTSDPSETLSYRKLVNSAYSAYTSNEIQRQSINVIEGRGTNTDKYNAIYGLYDAAIKNNNYDLAQSLNLQLDNLSVKIQNEQESAQRVAGQMAGYQVKSVKALASAMKSDLRELGRIYQDQGPEKFDKFLSDPEVQKQMIANNPALEKVFASGAKVGFWDIANGAVEQMKEAYQTAVNTLPPEDAADFKEELDKINTGETKFSIPGVGSITQDDIKKQADAVRAGGTYFYKGVDNTMEKGSLTNYTWAKDENGKYRLINQYASPGTSGQVSGFTIDQTAEDSNNISQVVRKDDKGNVFDSNGNIIGKYKDGQYLSKAGKALTEAQKNDLVSKGTIDYKTLLNQAGFVVEGNYENGLKIKGTEKSAGLMNIPGLDTSEPFAAVIDPQGNLRFTRKDPATGEDNLYQINFNEMGQAGFKQLKPGEQGPLAANDLYDVRQTQNMLKQDTTFEGLNAGNRSLSNTLDTLKMGDNFTHGKLQDPLYRAQWIKEGFSMSPEQKLANARQRGDQAEISRLETDIARTRLSGLQRPFAAIQNAVPSVARAINPSYTPGMAAANRSLAASNQAVLNTPAKYGIFSGSLGSAFKKYFVDAQNNHTSFSTNSVPARYVVSNKLEF